MKIKIKDNPNWGINFPKIDVFFSLLVSIVKNIYLGISFKKTNQLKSDSQILLFTYPSKINNREDYDCKYWTRLPHLLRDFTEKLDFFHIYTRTSHSMNPKKYSNSVWFKSRTSPDKHYTQYGTVTLGTHILLVIQATVCLCNREDSKNKFGNLFPSRLIY